MSVAGPPQDANRAPSGGSAAAELSVEAASVGAPKKPLSIVHTENSCGWGGQEIRILTEARGFLDRGHRVTLIAPAEAPIAPAAERLGVPVVRLDIRSKRPA